MKSSDIKHSFTLSLHNQMRSLGETPDDMARTLLAAGVTHTPMGGAQGCGLIAWLKTLGYEEAMVFGGDDSIDVYAREPGEQTILSWHTGYMVNTNGKALIEFVRQLDAGERPELLPQTPTPDVDEKEAPNGSAV